MSPTREAIAAAIWEAQWPRRREIHTWEQIQVYCDIHPASWISHRDRALRQADAVLALLRERDEVMEAVVEAAWKYIWELNCGIYHADEATALENLRATLAALSRLDAADERKVQS